MTVLGDFFHRRAVLEVGQVGALGFRADSRSGNLDKEGLRIAFDVEKTIHSSANTARIQVYNLSEANRSRASKGAVVRLSAGYGDLLELLYEGDVERADTSRSGADIMTTLECGDGSPVFAAQTINKTFPAGTPTMDVVLAVAKKFTESYPDYAKNPVKFDRDPKKKKASRLSVKGLERDLSRLKSSLEAQGFATVLRKPLSVSGNGREVMDELARMWRFFWSVQDGSIQVVAYGNSTQESVLLSKETGLLDVPSPTEYGVKTRSLIVPRLRPGGALTVKSATVNGQFRVETVKVSGDTRGGDWTTECEARSL